MMLATVGVVQGVSFVRIGFKKQKTAPMWDLNWSLASCLLIGSSIGITKQVCVLYVTSLENESKNLESSEHTSADKVKWIRGSPRMLSMWPCLHWKSSEEYQFQFYGWGWKKSKITKTWMWEIIFAGWELATISWWVW